MQIACDSGVTLTIDGVKIDDSSNDNACPLSFTGSGNNLTLDGESDLHAGWGQPGVKAESGTLLEISGSGVLETQGGFRGAGIGGGDGGGCGAITLSGGVIYAQRGDSAPYDIGNGVSGSAGTLSITGAAAVFLKTDSCITPATSHTHETITSLADNKVYGVSANGWTPVFGIYMDPYTLSYSLNGGTGTGPGSITQHLNTTTTVGSGSGVLRANYTFSGWNTAPNGSGTRYAAGSTFTFASDTTLYAQWTAYPTLSYDANGGSGTAPASVIQAAGTTTTVSDDSGISRSGYLFSGWNTAADGGGKSYATGSTFTFDADTMLYAQWTAQPKLTSSDDDAKIYTGGRVVLTPNIGGGTWSCG
jgi:hypothetical protein